MALAYTAFPGAGSYLSFFCMLRSIALKTGHPFAGDYHAHSVGTSIYSTRLTQMFVSPKKKKNPQLSVSAVVIEHSISTQE